MEQERGLDGVRLKQKKKGGQDSPERAGRGLGEGRHRTGLPPTQIRTVARAAASTGEGRCGDASFPPVWKSWGLAGPDPAAFVDVEWPVVRLQGTRVVREGKWQWNILARPTLP